ncbi:hypothetical protein GOD93_11090 [Sinorhizobium medicae]|nr:hypothetical protein [Sinorhizobium medicae]
MPWTPATPDHAIDRAQIKFEFETLPAKAHQRVAEIVKRASESVGLTDAVGIASPNFQILTTVEGPSQLVQDPKPQMARSFRKLGADGEPEYSAICASDSLAFDVRKYDGWSTIYPLIRACFEDAIRHINDNVSSVRAVRFEYWDRFVRQEVGGAHFLRADTRLAPPLLSNLQGSWHSHVGFFKFVDGKRLLLNANVDLMEAADVKTSSTPHLIPEGVNSLCRIYTLCLISPEGADAFNDIEDCLRAPDLAHSELKSMLGNIINQQLADQIQLAAEGFKI